MAVYDSLKQLGIPQWYVLVGVKVLGVQGETAALILVWAVRHRPDLAPKRGLR